MKIGDSGWQTTLADLSLILFMVMAAAVSAPAPKAPPPPPPPSNQPKHEALPRGEPVAIYRPGKGAPPLNEWLAGQWAGQQGPDPRQRLTIVVPYAAGGEARALNRARLMLRDAGQTKGARVIVEPGDPDSAYAALTFDVAP